MVDQKRGYIFLHLVGTFILVISLLSTPVFLFMQLMQMAGAITGGLMIGVGLVLMQKK